MVNKPLIRPYFLGGVALGGVARIPMIKWGVAPQLVTSPWMGLQVLPGKNEQIRPLASSEPTLDFQVYIRSFSGRYTVPPNRVVNPVHSWP